MPTVYIVEEALKRDPETGSLRPVHDFRPAAVYGNLVPLTTNKGASVLSPAPLVFELRSKLQHFTPDDYLLAVGDPVKIAIAAVLAAESTHGVVKMLKWDREARNYIAVEFDTAARS